MSLQLGQLIHTSFAEVGFRTLQSGAVPSIIEQVFLEQIVYRYWDSYCPPQLGYRAVYLHQVSPTQVLFGWLYNDGVDDFGRSHIPYFVCYYWTGRLQSAQLNLILTCLQMGPAVWIDRQQLPRSIAPVKLSGNYLAAQPGVVIPVPIREHSDRALTQGERLNWLVSSDALAQITSSSTNLALVGKGQAIDDNRRFGLSTSLLMAGIVSMAVLWAIAVGSAYVLRVFVDVERSQPTITQATPAASNPSSLKKTLTGHVDAVWSVVLSPDGKTLVSGSADRTIKLWNVETGQVLSTLVGHADTVRTLALSPNGKQLASGSGDNTIKLWDVPTNRLISTLTEPNSPVWSIAINPDGQTLVGGTGDGTVYLWQLPTGKLLRTIRVHGDRVFSVAISPDGKTLATGSLDNTIKLLDLPTGQLRRTLSHHANAVRSVAFSPDGQMLVSGSWDKTIKLWNWRTGKLHRTLTGHTSRVVTVAFGADGQTLVSGSVDQTIKRWRVQNGQLLQTLPKQPDWVLAIATHSQMIVNSSKDQQIRIWH